MHENERSIQVAREWVQKAEGDLRTAAHTLKLVEECPTEAVCFHAQQCVEKYVKAYLVVSNIEFPRTHDIGELITLMPLTVRLGGLSVEVQRRLTGYATVAGYSGDYEPISVREARAAVRIARVVRTQIRKLLPGAAIRKEHPR